MIGFEIECLSEKGELVLKNDLNANKKLFVVNCISDKPFIIRFLFKKKVFFKNVKENHLKYFIMDKMQNDGAIIDVDYSLRMV